MVARPGRQLPVFHLPQGPTHRGLIKGDAKLTMEPSRQVTQTPPHNAIKISDVLENKRKAIETVVLAEEMERIKKHVGLNR